MESQGAAVKSCPFFMSGSRSGSLHPIERKPMKETSETKVCIKCGRELPFDKFRLMKSKYYAPYYLGRCKECEDVYYREYMEAKNKIQFSDNIELLIDIKYKDIKPERILDISRLKIIPLGTDEVFVKLMDYRNIWLSNYGRLIRYKNDTYHLLQGNYDSNGALRYSVDKNVYFDGKWIFDKAYLYAAKAVVEEFIINPDKENNIYIWHSGYDKQDNYYRNLYPLNQEQYRIVKNHFIKTGDDSHEFIRKVINDIKYKPEDWSRKAMRPVMCGIGYRGSEGIDLKAASYVRWHDMIHRCYNMKFHERQPQYKECTVCEEWLNYNNFRVWYDKNIYGREVLDLDKDILFKGNTVYSPDTVVLVPHAVNTLFVNGKKNRGDYPIGVSFDNDKKKYRAMMSFMGKRIKLGTFRTAEEAFNRYKQYKEDFIKAIAERYREKIPYKAYEAMMRWNIEIDD